MKSLTKITLTGLYLASQLVIGGCSNRNAELEAILTTIDQDLVELKIEATDVARAVEAKATNEALVDELLGGTPVLQDQDNYSEGLERGLSANLFETYLGKSDVYVDESHTTTIGEVEYHPSVCDIAFLQVRVIDDNFKIYYKEIRINADHKYPYVEWITHGGKLRTFAEFDEESEKGYGGMLAELDNPEIHLGETFIENGYHSINDILDYYLRFNEPIINSMWYWDHDYTRVDINGAFDVPNLEQYNCD